ncbi:polyprenyl synthetase family protein [Desulfovibrio sp. OttesenSCG-928-C06]|nr:polyprenyl synthetase family protein [Desulfovibrio sp. OttesenSCG-928-C06]
MNFKEHLKQKSLLVEEFLSGCLDEFDTLGLPPGLKEAMNYSLLAGGKRIRPALCLSVATLFGLDSRQALPFAAGIEFIHTYSLIHDDLPAMDDDDMRRGRPSNHKQFDEATAILAGDALLTDAFVFMAKPAKAFGTFAALEPANVLAALSAVAAAAGGCGMVGGQFWDMKYTAKGNTTLEQLAQMQAAKTGALLAVSCRSGALLAGVAQDEVEKITDYGRWLGRAFQIVDDILDEIGDPEEMGKPVGSDREQGKSTYPSLLGLDRSVELAKEAGDSALAALNSLRDIEALPDGPQRDEALFLRELIVYILKRGS